MPLHHVPFPSIEHFKKAKAELRKYYKLANEDGDEDTEADSGHEQERERKPKQSTTLISLRGTVKLHGTHADIVFTNTESINETTINDGAVQVSFQSRNRILTKEMDNCGFARHMESIGKEVLFEKLAKPALTIYFSSSAAIQGGDEEVNQHIKDAKGNNVDAVQQLMISGEYCGGNIQKGVAINGLPTMFVIFAIKINEQYQDPWDYRDLALPDQRIHNIFRVPPYRLQFTLSACDDVENRLKQITDEVERECPYGKSFGMCGVGEGVVWCAEEFPQNTRFYFKVKGEEHTTSRVTTLKVRSEEELALLADARNFAKLALPEPRLQQGLDHLREMSLEVSPQNTSKFLQWAVNDVLKEEADEIKEAGLDLSKLKKELSCIALNYYKTKADRRLLHQT